MLSPLNNRGHPPGGTFLAQLDSRIGVGTGKGDAAAAGENDEPPQNWTAPVHTFISFDYYLLKLSSKARSRAPAGPRPPATLPHFRTSAPVTHGPSYAIMRHRYGHTSTSATLPHFHTSALPHFRTRDARPVVRHHAPQVHYFIPSFSFKAVF
jgi:hypothetical protein